MSDRTEQRDVQRIVFFGMRCSFSAPPLSALIDAGYDVLAIVLPGARFGPPILRQQATSAFPIFSTESSLWDIDALANKSSSPVLTIGDLNHPHAIGALADLKPDLIVTACFPDLLPPEVLNIPRQGALNVH